MLADWSEVFPDMRWETERVLDAGEILSSPWFVRSARPCHRLEVGTEPYGVIFAVRDGESYESTSPKPRPF